jgi:phosphatidylserine/phosphatidylglycerophosphate/cardiolipin synthase-like enzyme
MTIIGSSNLNARSAHLDTELGFAIFTQSPTLRQDLYNEKTSLLEPSERVDFNTWADPSRHIRPLARLLVRCGVDKML